MDAFDFLVHEFGGIVATHSAINVSTFLDSLFREVQRCCRRCASYFPKPSIGRRANIEPIPFRRCTIVASEHTSLHGLVGSAVSNYGTVPASVTCVQRVSWHGRFLTYVRQANLFSLISLISLVLCFPGKPCLTTACTASFILEDAYLGRRTPPKRVPRGRGCANTLLPTVLYCRKASSMSIPILESMRALSLPKSARASLDK